MRLLLRRQRVLWFFSGLFFSLCGFSHFSLPQIVSGKVSLPRYSAFNCRNNWPRRDHVAKISFPDFYAIGAVIANSIKVAAPSKKYSQTGSFAAGVHG